MVIGNAEVNLLEETHSTEKHLDGLSDYLWTYWILLPWMMVYWKISQLEETQFFEKISVFIRTRKWTFPQIYGKIFKFPWILYKNLYVTCDQCKKNVYQIHRKKNKRVFHVEIIFKKKGFKKWFSDSVIRGVAKSGKSVYIFLKVPINACKSLAYIFK